MTGATAQLMKAIANNGGRAVTVHEAAALIGLEPGKGHRVGPSLWWLTQKGYLVKLEGFPWWAQRWGVPRLWR